MHSRPSIPPSISPLTTAHIDPQGFLVQTTIKNRWCLSITCHTHLSFLYNECERIIFCGISHMSGLSAAWLKDGRKNTTIWMTSVLQLLSGTLSFFLVSSLTFSLCWCFSRNIPHEALPPLVLFYPSSLTHISHFKDIPDQVQCSVIGNVKIEDKYAAYI